MAETTVGRTVVLSSEWRSFTGGPLVDLDTNPSISIVPLAGGPPILGPTTTGVQHIATGLYSYAWPAVATPDEYVVLWQGLASGDAVQATESLIVLAAASGSGPCGWDVDPTALGVCPGWAAYSEAVKTTALALATTWLWGATGRRFGPCPISVRPSQPCGEAPVYQEFSVIPGAQGLNQPGGPFLFGGRWFNAGCQTACCGNSACAVVLRGPVYAVSEVLVGATVVPASAYRVDVTSGAHLLVRTDGQCWPVCQDWRAEPGEASTFEITYEIGEAVPTPVLIAAAALACQYGKHLTGADCALPARMTRLSRQGVEIEVDTPDPSDGKSGIKIVDDVVALYNPSGRKSPPMVMSPDLPESCDRYTVIPQGS